MDSSNVASVHDTSGYASIRADTFKRGKKMEEVEVNGRRIVSGKLYEINEGHFFRVRENDPVVWVEEIRQTRQDKQVMLSVTEVIAATAIELDYMKHYRKDLPREQLIDHELQWVLTNNHAYVYGHQVVSESPIVAFDPRGCACPPIIPTMWWLRTDLTLHRTAVKKEHHIYQIEVHPRAMCLGAHDCQYSGVYDPPRHVVLRCQTCNCWYHRECGKVTGLLNELLADARERHKLPAFLRYDRHDQEDEDDEMWAAIRALPLQRNHPTVKFGRLTTLEGVIVAARAEETRPGDVRAWARQQIREAVACDDGGAVKAAARMMNEVLERCPSERVVYQCPNGHFM
ncbi:hypothetical protein C8Q76DRAFT_790488 [Earliella scabrosa]|nr:hypothetical protein C8Q76DRAFT_790488 [Earliella scabrosa]